MINFLNCPPIISIHIQTRVENLAMSIDEYRFTKLHLIHGMEDSRIQWLPISNIPSDGDSTTQCSRTSGHHQCSVFILPVIFMQKFPSGLRNSLAPVVIFQPPSVFSVNYHILLLYRKCLVFIKWQISCR